MWVRNKHSLYEASEMWELRVTSVQLSLHCHSPTVVRIYNAQRHLAWCLAQSQCSGNGNGNYGYLSRGYSFPFFLWHTLFYRHLPPCCFMCWHLQTSRLLHMYCFQGSCSDDEIYSPLKNQLMCVPYGGFFHTCVHPHIQGWPCDCCVYVYREPVLNMFTLDCSPLTCLSLLPGCGDPKRRILPCSSLQFRTSNTVCLKVDIQQNVRINKCTTKEGDKTIPP